MSLPCWHYYKHTRFLIKAIALHTIHHRCFTIDFIEKKTLRVIRTKMLRVGDPNLLSPPDTIRGIKQLDKTLFTKQIQLPIIMLGDLIVSKVLPVLKKYVLKMDHLKPIQSAISDGETKENSSKFVLLNPIFVQKWDDILEIDRTSLVQVGITCDCFKLIDFTLNYENWKVDELLRCILPEDQDGVAGFSKIGHIIHLNLRDHVLEYKNLIGQILLDKIAGARTVVNKLNKIDSTFRNFEMEVLGGDKDMFVQVKENKCIFEFDFSTVYWNPRLSTEHERIVNILKAGDILYDVFAGVGPFAIPAARKNCIVFANDLNPESFNWLNHNAKINKINQNHLQTFNKDGVEFIQTYIKNDLKKRFENGEINQMYITMNLPGSAVEFLPVFNNLLTNSGLDHLEITNYPRCFVYCFAKGEMPEAIARDLVESHLGHKLPADCEISHVRTVSSFKEMMRVSFKLNREILFGLKRPGEQQRRNTSDIKKLCQEHGEKQGETDEKCVQSCGSEKS